MKCCIIFLSLISVMSYIAKKKKNQPSTNTFRVETLQKCTVCLLKFLICAVFSHYDYRPMY